MMEFTTAPFPRGYFFLLIPTSFVLLKSAIYFLTKGSKNKIAVSIARFINSEFTMMHGGWGYEIYCLLSGLCVGICALVVITYYPLRNEAIKKFENFDAYKERIESREMISHEIILQAEKYNVWMEDAVDGYNKNFTVKGYDFKPIDTKALWEKHGGNKCCATFEELQDK